MSCELPSELLMLSPSSLPSSAAPARPHVSHGWPQMPSLPSPICGHHTTGILSSPQVMSAAIELLICQLLPCLTHAKLCQSAYAAWQQSVDIQALLHRASNLDMTNYNRVGVAGVTRDPDHAVLNAKR
jgi:hypothetical protein